MNTETLKDYRLTLDDWLALAALGAGVLTPKPIHVEMLILAGLVTRDDDNPVLTSEGHEAAAAIDMIFDWHEFAFAESPESPSKALAEAETVELPAKPAERPKPLSVGSLVRHVPTGGVGLITQHTMWDADWGAFSVEFCGPVDNVVDGRVVNQLRRITDRGDKFERV